MSVNGAFSDIWGDSRSNPASDDEDFVMRATATADIPTSGTWTFAVNHDDHVRLDVNGSVVESTNQVDVEMLVVDIARSGRADIELIFQEQAGGAYVQLYPVEGDWSTFGFSPDVFRLVGDVFGGGLALIDATLPADFDEDGDVDGDDFLAWQGGFGIQAGAQKSDGDYDNDGDVDGDDFLGWQAEFGSGSGAASAAVPEPVSVTVLLVLAAVGMLSRRGATGRPSC